MAKEYITANVYGRKIFGCKTYKLALSAATTCPNRDGTVGVGGCTFCSAGGSGDFAASACLPVSAQIEAAKRQLGKKGEGSKFIAYFQSFTGTHGDLHHLEEIYQQAVAHPEIAGLSIATRPDCLGTDALAILRRLSLQKPLWVELGLQTIHEKTARRINRCYPLSVYVQAMQDLKNLPVHRITHVILGLPGESPREMLDTVRFVGAQTDGIKLQLLHVLKNTPMAKSYENGEFDVLSADAYYHLIADALELLPDWVVVHRLTGDGAKKDLIAPLWSADKKRVLVDLNRLLRQRDIYPAQQTLLP